MDVPEAQLEETEQGLVYKGDGWFVVNFVHCRPFAEHTIVGGREGCVVFGVGSRERHTEIGPDGERRGKEGESEYTVDETALKYSAGIERGTPQNEAYSRFPPRRFVRYGGWLD